MAVRYYHISEGYKRNVIVIGEDEAKNRIKYRTVTDMVSVIFQPARRLGLEDPNRYIYGQISVKVGKSNDSVPVFSRTREDPALVVLRDERRNFLVFPDGVDPPPALEAITQSNSIRITMTLHEKMSSGPDELILQVTDYEYTDIENELGRCAYFDIEDPNPKPKYLFQVCYASIWGARAEIEVMVKPPMEEEEEGGGSIPRKLKPPMEEEEEGGSILSERKRPVSISAKIAVIQNMRDHYNCSCGQTMRTLYDKSEEEVHAGDKLRLQRSVFGLPMARDQFLTLVFTPPTVPPKKPLLSMPEDPVLVDLTVKQVSEDSSMTITEDVPGTFDYVSYFTGRSLTRDFSIKTSIISNRCSKRFTEEAIQQIKKDNITKLVVLPLYPQFSISTTGSSTRVLQEIFREDVYLSGLPVSIIKSWYQREGYIKSMADLIEKGLESFSNPKEVMIFFSAHGVPVSYVTDAGDPYKDQMEECIYLIMQELKAREIHNDHTLAYQSRVGPVQWLKPYTDEVLVELGQKGVKSLLAVPVSFVSEHIETLEEIDMEYKELALESGIENWGRVPALNCTSSFINDLADAVIEALPSAAAMSTHPKAEDNPVRYAIKTFFGSMLGFVLLFSLRWFWHSETIPSETSGRV